MRNKLPRWVEQSRCPEPLSPEGAMYGAFVVRARVMTSNPEELRVIASDGDAEIPWEHVSVSLAHRCPTWDEMDYIKRIWWRGDECVMQLHVPDKNHINCHPHCLHLWKPKLSEIPMPPMVAV